MLSTTIAIIQKDNFSGLWKGVTPVCNISKKEDEFKYSLRIYSFQLLNNFKFQSITRVIPGVGLYFSTLHWLQSTLNLNDPITSVQAFTLGITARTISGALLIPITVVKTRYEVN